MRKCNIGGCEEEYYALDFCHKHYDAQRYIEHPEWKNNNKWRINHPRLYNEYQRKWRANNHELFSSYIEKYKTKHPDRVKKAQEKYRAHYPERIKEIKKKWKSRNPNYDKERYATDIQFRLSFCLRRRFSNALRRYLKGSKVVSAVRDLGCSMGEFKNYMESKFKLGMNWDNYGNKIGCWSIDHIVPLSNFDLTDKNQALRAVHHTNLQPLWHIENMKKSNKVGTQ